MFYEITVPFVMPVAVVLLQCIGVGGCWCPISCKVSLMVLDFLHSVIGLQVLPPLSILRKI